ncbi:MAG: hypothetical protein KKE20_05595 [Nanoarchaeota archaeon]|nr:hypothetical protein [Nanoarchaeota archaeon]
MKELTQAMTENIRRMLSFYHDLSAGSLEFEEVPEVQDVSKQKPYSYRTDVPVKCIGQDIGKLTVIGFRLGDGTGAESDQYKLRDLIVPGKYIFETKPEKVVPREKLRNGVHAELMFPMFTINADSGNAFGEVYDNSVCLEELTLASTEGQMKIVRYGLLGAGDPQWFMEACESGARVVGKPSPMFTTGQLPWGPRFGDPHSVVYTNLGYGRDAQKGMAGDPDFLEKRIQVAGFLPIGGQSGYLHSVVNRMFDRGQIRMPYQE